MHTPKGNETATYGSEFVAARTAVDQIIDIRTTLQYLGVPIRDKSYMFGDNRSVVTVLPSPTPPSPKDTIWHPIIESGKQLQLNTFHWKDGKSNPADILSKHWEFTTVWPMLKPTEFRQPIQMQSHLEMPGFLVQLGCIQCT